MKKENFDAKFFIDECIKWIKEWFKENGKGCKAVIGMSGGKDSTVAAALVARALGADCVYGFAMPDINQGVNDADKICEYLGIHYAEVPLKFITADIKVVLSREAVLGNNISEQTKQNIPPRVRMTMLYALAQSLNGRVVGTCNASELYIGYATRYGDLASDFEPLACLTCRQVVEVGRALGIPAEWVEKIPDDGLPLSEPDDEKFKKWGFTYETLDKFLEEGTCGDRNIDALIADRHQSQIFKMGLGKPFVLDKPCISNLKKIVDDAFEKNRVNKEEANIVLLAGLSNKYVMERHKIADLLKDINWDNKLNKIANPVRDLDCDISSFFTEYLEDNNLSLEDVFDYDENENCYCIIAITREYDFVAIYINSEGLMAYDKSLKIIGYLI